MFNLAYSCIIGVCTGVSGGGHSAADLSVAAAQAAAGGGCAGMRTPP